MTYSDQPNADAFWNDHARQGRGRRIERTREHTAITKGMRRPHTGATPVVGGYDRTSPPGAGLFDDIPDDPFADEFGLGTYAGLSPDATFTGEPQIDHELELEPVRRRRAGGSVGVDPLLARIGAIVVAAVISVPIIGAFGGKGDAEESTDSDRVASDQEQSTTASTQPRQKKPADTAAAQKSAAASKSADAGTDGPLSDSPMGPTELADDGDGADGGTGDVQALAATATVACGSEYEVVAGDYWLRLADASGTDLDELLVVNDATVDTPLYPGGEICLPAGASTPAPPATQAPVTAQASTTDEPTTDAPTTEAPSTQEPTTQPPTTEPPTTEPPTTEPPATEPPPEYTGNVQDIIRSVWPDHLEDRALEIAQRESNFVPTARNYCCYGLFQIYYESHSNWLPSVGVSSAEDLFDPYLNTLAAYTLYQRSGGWGPWAL